ncbi:hypothetical protein Q6301_26155, partial [Klebsiella quasipneumoniae]|uniref:hypothetical protein n=1 Tax=Klebsiella quasipneumoniae TaxID=1463165 RepID=UPI00272F0611
EWVHVQLHQQKGMISLSPPTICNSASAFPESWLHAHQMTWRRQFGEHEKPRGSHRMMPSTGVKITTIIS